MRGFRWSAGLVGILFFASCGHKAPDEKKDTTEGDSLAVVSDVMEKDTTIYGVSDEFGMSTFTLITDSGDTLSVTRESESGESGRVYGDLVYGNRYAMTTRDAGEAIDVLINLTQLERFTKDYEIRNGHLVLAQGSDTVEIKEISREQFRAKGHSGKAYHLKSAH